MSERQRVVLVGGGAGILDTYAVLARHGRRAIRQGRLELIVLSAHIPLVAMPSAAVVPALVRHIDRSRRVVTYVRVGAAGWGSVERLRYDELVLETGWDPRSPVPASGLEGLRDRSALDGHASAGPALAPGVWRAEEGLGRYLLRVLSGAPAPLSGTARPSGAAGRGGSEAGRRTFLGWTTLLRNGFATAPPPAPAGGLIAVPTAATAPTAPAASAPGTAGLTAAPRRYAAVTTARRTGAGRRSAAGPSPTGLPAGAAEAA